MRPIEGPERRRAELGFTLIEVVVVVAIVAMFAGLAYEALAQRPAQARSTAVAFGALVADARALAAITSDAAGGGGASIGVIRDGDTSVATLYAYRPIAGALHGPTLVPNTPPLRTTTALLLVQAGRTLEPPFALFFSASGHLSAQAPFTIGSDASLPAEPACSLETGIAIAFVDGAHNQAYAISCEFARLDLDAMAAVGSR